MHGPRHALLCLGNELHGDDGFGPAVGRALAAHGLPAPWQLVQAGTRGLEALAALQDCEAAIVVDAAAPAGQPGRLRRWQPAQVALEDARADHGLGLGWVLRALQSLHGPATGGVPRLCILTAEMSELAAFRLGLSDPVQAAVPEAAARLRRWMQEGWDEPAPR
jgi:hydrogenase maturation protease/hydrogenase 3 maturation protease